MQNLGINGTPLTLIGVTPAPGAPMKVVSSIYGARPYRRLQGRHRRRDRQAR